MVSLNEKRSKTRYVVQNKTEWMDDGEKFGKRMLEKMGWQTGLGLGKNKDGRTEHIHLKFKDNLKGIGFLNGKCDDTWIEHSQSFDSVLQQLQQSHPSTSVSSLHNFNQTVQQTKTRFNYKKQSSGKDLSSRSNNELDCIFGWNKTNPTNLEQLSEQEKESESLSDNLYITSNKSMKDYFKEKSLKKAQRQFQQTNTNQLPSVDPPSSSDPMTIDDQEIIDEPTKKSRKKKRIDEDENPYLGSNVSSLIGYPGWNIDTSFENILKKKSKQKKRKNKI